MCIYLVRTPSHIYITYILYYANALEMENSAITNNYEYLLDYLNFFDMIQNGQNGNIL